MLFVDALRIMAQEERAACPEQRWQAALSDRFPIEQWRSSQKGADLERQILSAVQAPYEQRPEQFISILHNAKDWLPCYLHTILAHLAEAKYWQPPLNDFVGKEQRGLYLIERREIKLSLIHIEPNPGSRDRLPPLIRLSSGNILLHLIEGQSPLLFRTWALIKDAAKLHVERANSILLGKGDVAHCSLSSTYWHPSPPKSPALILRLEWPEEDESPDRYFDAENGHHIPQMISGSALRRHMALEVICALHPENATQFLLHAIRDTSDEALAWHYCRRLVSLSPPMALPILSQWSQSGPKALQYLSQQCLHVLRDRYAFLFENM